MKSRLAQTSSTKSLRKTQVPLNLPDYQLHPCTKPINTCYHHFHEHVHLGLIKIYPVGTKDQIADVLTKALPQNDLQIIKRQFDLLSTQSIAGRECAISRSIRNYHLRIFWNISVDQDFFVIRSRLLQQIKMEHDFSLLGHFRFKLI